MTESAIDLNRPASTPRHDSKSFFLEWRWSSSTVTSVISTIVSLTPAAIPSGLTDRQTIPRILPGPADVEWVSYGSCTVNLSAGDWPSQK